MRNLVRWAAAAVALLGAAAPARAGDDPRAEIEALRRELAAQERRLRELENRAPTEDEIALSLERYLAASPAPIPVGGADGGRAGWPAGGAPYIAEGPNRLNFHFRNQVRYEAFWYSDDAVGTLSSPPDALSGAAPRDRSGFEIERLNLMLDGSVFCPEITYNVLLNFDSDQGAGVEKEYAWIDWKYVGDHHVRAGLDKIPFTYGELNSYGALAFVERSMFVRAFGLDCDTGIEAWGRFGGGGDEKPFLYRLMASTGEGPVYAAGSVFGKDAFDGYADTLLCAGLFEWTITGKEWPFDEVDNRPCDQRGRLDLSVGAYACYEDDDDASEKSPGGLALRAAGPLVRRGLGGYVRGRYAGWTLVAEAAVRDVDYTAGASAPSQTDSGAGAMVHYRFANSPLGLGAKASAIWLDEDWRFVPVGATQVRVPGTIWEVGGAVNWFFHDHANKVTADLTRVFDNSGVRTTSAGYMADPSKGVVVEDGWMLRIQWQLQF